MDPSPFAFALAMVRRRVRAQWCFRVVNESGQVLLLLSLIAIGREIGREVQVRRHKGHAVRARRTRNGD